MQIVMYVLEIVDFYCQSFDVIGKANVISQSKK